MGSKDNGVLEPSVISTESAGAGVLSTTALSGAAIWGSEEFSGALDRDATERALFPRIVRLPPPPASFSAPMIVTGRSCSRSHPGNENGCTKTTPCNAVDRMMNEASFKFLNSWPQRKRRERQRHLSLSSGEAGCTSSRQVSWPRLYSTRRAF